MFYKKILILLLILNCIFCNFGCKNQEFEPPDVDISVVSDESTKLNYLTKLSTKENSTDDPQTIFSEYKIKYPDLSYVESGNTIQVQFNPKKPDSILLVDYVINEHFSEEVSLKTELVIKDNKTQFTLDFHPAAALSDKIISKETGIQRGLKLICKFGDVTCEYVFALKTYYELNQIPGGLY